MGDREIRPSIRDGPGFLNRAKYMSEPREVYIEIEDAGGPHPLKVRDDETLGEVLARLRAEHPHAQHLEPELLAVFVEDAEAEVPKDKKFHEWHHRHPRIVHCHRCHHIEVTVFYNGDQKHAFRPNSTIRKILDWAVNTAFHADTNRKWVLRLGGTTGDILDLDKRLGTLVKHPECHISLYLTEREAIKG